MCKRKVIPCVFNIQYSKRFMKLRVNIEKKNSYVESNRIRMEIDKCTVDFLSFTIKETAGEKIS